MEKTPRRQPIRTADDGSGRSSVVTVRSLAGLALWALVVYVCFRYIRVMSLIVLSLLGAAAIAATLRPIVNRFRGPMALRAVVVMLALVLLLAGILFVGGWTLASPVRENIAKWPQVAQRADGLLGRLGNAMGLDEALTLSRMGDVVGQMLTGRSVAGWIVDVAESTLKMLLAVVLVVVGAIYLLIQPPEVLSRTLAKLLPPPRQQPTLQALDELQPLLRRWVIGSAASMLLIGITFGVGYWLIGLDLALPLALLAAMAELVPTFGPLGTLLLSLAVASTQGLVQILGVCGVYVIAQSAESYVVTPIIMKRAVRIPPMVTLLTVILWGNVFGLAGVILAVPIDLTIWVFLKHHLVVPHEKAGE